VRRGHVASDGHHVTAAGRGRAGPGQAGGGGQTSRESGDGGKARAARAGLDGRLGLRPHIRCDAGQRGAPSHGMARLVGGRAPSSCYPVTAAVEAVGRAIIVWRGCWGLLSLGQGMVWPSQALTDSRPSYGLMTYLQYSGGRDE
jgi:hypothetical protein